MKCGFCPAEAAFIILTTVPPLIGNVYCYGCAEARFVAAWQKQAEAAGAKP